jgi:hypothetical protein
MNTGPILSATQTHVSNSRPEQKCARINNKEVVGGPWQQFARFTKEYFQQAGQCRPVATKLTHFLFLYTEGY